MNILRITLALCVVLLAGYACNSSSKSTSSGSPVADQIATGKMVFADNCAKCHGDMGQGTQKAPPLVGKGALPLNPRPDQKKRMGQFKTALDVATFATRNMPPDAEERAEMKTSEYWAVLAFALSANGIKLTEPVGPDNAARIVLHP